MRNDKPTKKPASHSVFLVEGEGESSYWTKIGGAWLHEDGEGLNVSLSAIPVSGRLVIRKRQPKSQGGQGE